MKIWVDADGCPKRIRDILYAISIKTKTPLTLVSNHFIEKPISVFIKSIIVESGPNSADKEITKLISRSEIVVTSDIPLIRAAVKKGAVALTARGQFFCKSNRSLLTKGFTMSRINDKHACRILKRIENLIGFKESIHG